MIIHADTNAFQQAMDKKGTFIVDFFATWCGPCKMLGAVMEKLSADELPYDILKIDIDRNLELAEKYDVQVVPTLLFIKNGEVAYREAGFFSKDKFLALANDHLK